MRRIGRCRSGADPPLLAACVTPFRSRTGFPDPSEMTPDSDAVLDAEK
ncbi:hypothetical protein ACIBEH_24260 [Nocardia salmonicida]